jgi:MFS family permease
MSRRYTRIQWLLYANAFLLGFALMSLEMLGSRYLYPYYGGSIHTWAALIATVLAALMVGYFVGGFVADRRPSISLLGGVVLTSALCVAAIPRFADPLLVWMLVVFGDGAGSVLAASAAMLLVPLALLGAYSPFAVRLAVVEYVRSGSVSGAVFGISTFGNILGTLVTTFYLIPSIGTRLITYVLAVLIAIAGSALLFFSHTSQTPP